MQPQPSIANKIQSGKEKAIEEEVKDTVQRRQHAEEKLNSLVKKASTELFRTQTLFPFDIFPDTLIIDTNKITYIYRNFLSSETVTTLLLREITDVTVECTLFMAQLNMSYCHHPMKPMSITIPGLPKKEAMQAKEIIQGILVLLKENVDITTITSQNITDKLQQIGSTD
jgi:hypothetical protein